MKLNTLTIVAKAVCYIVVGAGANLATSLAQWANSGEWPARIQWVVIVTGAAVAGATQLLAFLSGSFAGYVQERKTDAVGTGQPQQPKPTGQN